MFEMTCLIQMEKMTEPIFIQGGTCVDKMTAVAEVKGFRIEAKPASPSKK